MKNRIFRNFLFLFISFGFFSCVSQKDVTYFQSTNTKDSLTAMNVQQAYVIKLQTGDILSVMVNSLSPEANSMFNPYVEASRANTSQNITNNAPAAAEGYLIDVDGNITLPLVGKLKVSGLTVKQTTDLITEKLDKYLQQPTVNVRLINFKISILGEVVRPSVYTIPNEQITVPQALALAGDLTIYGKRKNIMVVRETDGKREFGHVDLTSRNMFNSPYYYLHANDVVYVEPSSGKLTSTDRLVQLLPLLISAVSLLTVILK
ncbi:polysaccharide export protein [Pedobacter sp. HMF7647]|uniref:Polysaccharide export protein n=1 Tax=Hufsiella arboris TaxID=2695275 RepID=A0A7K1YCG8_9SPHI|nr:polysaccharide biosynthesis/export family protein [Hufsiella arboris]MXV52130.1 polysaccharide export protein [Hufsiella arboris]